MFYGFDGELRRQLKTLRQLNVQRRRTPTHEWPVVHVAEHEAILVVREWPGGELTASMMCTRRDL
jgi:hypothetical protein